MPLPDLTLTARERTSLSCRPRPSVLRVLTDKQADRGVSLDAQRAKLKAYAELYELDLVDVIVDAGHSAKSLDRLTRSVVDLGTLVERYFAPGKAALLSVGEQIDTCSAAGRLVLNVLASVTSGSGRRSGNAPPRRAAQGAPGRVQPAGGRPTAAVVGKLPPQRLSERSLVH